MTISWREQGACKDIYPGVFYPYDPETDLPMENEETSAEAKSICGRCAVRLECLETAVANRETIGIWGGLTTKERREYARTMKR